MTYNVVKDCKVKGHKGKSDASKLLLLMSLQNQAIINQCDSRKLLPVGIVIIIRVVAKNNHFIISFSHVCIESKLKLTSN